MKDIKTRENKKDIKMLDRAAGLAKVTKDTTVRTKDQIQNLSDDGQITPDEYAENKVKNTVCFFGYREIYNLFELEEKLEEHIRILLESKEYVEFLVGRNGEFDQLVSSTVRRVKRNYRDDNSALVLVLPYLWLSMKRMKKPFKSITTKWRYAKVPRRRISKPQCRFAIVRWLTVPIWLSATLNITVAVPFRPCSMQKRKTKRLLIFQTNNGRFASLLLH